MANRPLLGWQGIIPSKARKMAAISVDATISKIGTVEEIFQQIDPKVLAQHIIENAEPRIEEYVDEMMLKEYPTFWENLPNSARRMVYDRVRKATPQLVDNLVSDISVNIEDLLDIKGMVIDRLAKDKRLLNRIFLECGDVEFRFIVNSGLYFGFLFGLIQMSVWYFYQSWWVLPFFGLLVGYATNWIALNVIFRPLHEKKIGPFRLQGLFLKRQNQVAESFCHIVTHEILTVGNIINAIIEGPKGDRARNMVKKHIKPLVDETAGMGKAPHPDGVRPHRIRKPETEGGREGDLHLAVVLQQPHVRAGSRPRGGIDHGGADDRAVLGGVPGPAAPLLPGGRNQAHSGGCVPGHDGRCRPADLCVWRSVVLTASLPFFCA